MLDISDFNSNYFYPLLHKLSKESSRQIFSLGDFNIKLLKYESSELINSFLDTLSSNFLSHQIILPTRISSSSALIDKIFCNLTHTTKSISGNLTSTVSDRLPQFIVLPVFFSNAPPPKYNIYRHDWKKFDEEKFMFEFNCQDWDNNLVLDKENVNERIDNYLQNLNNLLEKHAPLKN